MTANEQRKADEQDEIMDTLSVDWEEDSEELPDIDEALAILTPHWEISEIIEGLHRYANSNAGELDRQGWRELALALRGFADQCRALE